LSAAPKTAAESSSGAAAPRRRPFEGVLAYFERRVFIMLLLGFSSGLPFLLVFGTLSAWLRQAGIPKTEIGFVSYVGLAYTIKFLWAPVLDHLRLPLLDRALGRRRAWMILAQIVIALGLLGIASSDPGTSLVTVASFALLVAFGSATQDIAVDAWRIEAAPKERQGVMAGAYQLGYRLALIASGAGALYIAQYASWHISYSVMAALMCVGFLAALFAPRLAEHREAAVVGEAKVEEAAERLGLGASLAHAMAFLYRTVVAPFVDFFARHKWSGLLILALIGAYRLPDFVMGVMANPLYIDLGFSLAEIASIAKLYGVGMSITGALVGGAVVARLGLFRTLLIGVTAVLIGNLSFAWLATRGHDFMALTIAISAENFASGFAGTALIAYMSSLTNVAFTATQYALFSSFYALPGKLLGGLSGWAVDQFGFVALYITTTAMALPAMALVLAVMAKNRAGRDPAKAPATGAS
jgi:PAT family beta-lactamase induction signal transducer AmpG